MIRIIPMALFLLFVVFPFRTMAADLEPAINFPKDKTSLAQTCQNLPATAKAAIQSYPVILQGRFLPDGKFNVTKTYKGFKTWPLDITAAMLSAVPVQSNKSALVFIGRPQKESGLLCNNVLYEGGSLNNIGFTSLLAEAVIYEAEVKVRMEEANDDRKDVNIYSNLSRFLDETMNPLAQIERAANLLRAVPDMRKAKDEHHKWRMQQLTERFSECRVDGTDGVLGQEMRTLITDIRNDIETSDGWVHVGFRDMGRGLIAIGAYWDAMHVLCGAGSPNLYLEAAVKAGQGAALAGNLYSDITSIEGLDLSGLILRKLSARGEWKDIKVTGTDLTNARFDHVKLQNINLEDAKLDLATYDCKTEFPPGFDPVSHHMIPSRCGDGTPVPKVDISNVHIKPFFNDPIDTPLRNPRDAERRDYDDITLNGVDLDGIKATNAILGLLDCFNCNFKNADFEGAIVAIRLTGSSEVTRISEASFKKADLRGSHFNSVHFKNTNFNDANLADVKFSRVVFRNVDFKNANLKGATFDSVQYDATTVFSPDFPLEEAGLIKVTE